MEDSESKLNIKIWAFLLVKTALPFYSGQYEPLVKSGATKKKKK